MSWLRHWLDQFTQSHGSKIYWKVFIKTNFSRDQCTFTEVVVKFWNVGPSYQKGTYHPRPNVLLTIIFTVVLLTVVKGTGTFYLLQRTSIFSHVPILGESPTYLKALPQGLFKSNLAPRSIWLLREVCDICTSSQIASLQILSAKAYAII